MSREGMKKMLVAGVVVFGLSLCAAQANAGWWWGAAPVYYGGWDCCGTNAYVVPFYSRGYGYGVHHRAAYRSGCGWSCCGNPCCTPVSCGCSSVASWGSPVASSCGCGMATITTASGGAEGQFTTPTPAVAPSSAGTLAKPSMTPMTPIIPAEKPLTPPEKPLAPPAGIPSSTVPLLPDGGGIIPPVPNRTSIEPMAGDGGILTVYVPNEAKVTINGLLTKSTGSKRHFVSYGLLPGYTYKYEVKAEVVREGKIVTEVQTISLKAGDRGGVAFGFNIPSTEGLAQTE
ncbi:MAG: TIGR03000 domain-containing protein [Planctomycetota bacterium]